MRRLAARDAVSELRPTHANSRARPHAQTTADSNEGLQKRLSPTDMRFKTAAVCLLIYPCTVSSRRPNDSGRQNERATGKKPRVLETCATLLAYSSSRCDRDEVRGRIRHESFAQPSFLLICGRLGDASGARGQHASGTGASAGGAGQ